MPLIVHPDYSTVTTCSCCRTENVGTKMFPADAMMEKPERHLCYLCAATMASSYHMTTSYHEVFPVIEVMVGLANILLKEIRRVPLDEPERDDTETRP